MQPTRATIHPNLGVYKVSGIMGYGEFDGTGLPLTPLFTPLNMMANGDCSMITLGTIYTCDRC